MKVVRTELEGVVLIETVIHGDDRGFFRELWHSNRYSEHGLGFSFVQDNASRSSRGVLRGLHYQHPRGQGKLVSVLEGAIWDVAVDIRCGSPSFGRWIGYELSAANGRQLFIPPTFAHGFAVTSETALVSYKCTDLYRPEEEGTILWNDPAIGIEWPIDEPSLSPKDASGVALGDVPPDRLPQSRP